MRKSNCRKKRQNDTDIPGVRLKRREGFYCVYFTCLPPECLSQDLLCEYVSNCHNNTCFHLCEATFLPGREETLEMRETSLVGRKYWIYACIILYIFPPKKSHFTLFQYLSPPSPLCNLVQRFTKSNIFSLHVPCALYHGGRHGGRGKQREGENGEGETLRDGEKTHGAAVGPM